MVGGGTERSGDGDGKRDRCSTFPWFGLPVRDNPAKKSVQVPENLGIYWDPPLQTR